MGRELVVLVLVTVRSVSVRAGDIFHLHPLFLFKTKGPRAPESGGFVSVLLGIFLPPSCGIEESTSSKTFSPFPCGDSLNRHCALWLSDSLPRNLNFLGDLLLWKGKGQSPP